MLACDNGFSRDYREAFLLKLKTITSYLVCSLIPNVSNTYFILISSRVNLSQIYDLKDKPESLILASIGEDILEKIYFQDKFVEK